MKKDFLGIAASSLCAVHCLATPVIILLVPSSIGKFWESPIIHYIFAAIVAFFCLSAGISGYRSHGDLRIMGLMCLALLFILVATFIPHDDCCQNNSVAFLVSGSLVMILGHILNYRACCIACRTENSSSVD